MGYGNKLFSLDEVIHLDTLTIKADLSTSVYYYDGRQRFSILKGVDARITGVAIAYDVSKKKGRFIFKKDRHIDFTIESISDETFEKRFGPAGLGDMLVKALKIAEFDITNETEFTKGIVGWKELNDIISQLILTDNTDNRYSTNFMGARLAAVNSGETLFDVQENYQLDAIQQEFEFEFQ